MMTDKRRIGTKCVQSGWTPANGEPRVLPIIKSTTFKYENSEEMALLFFMNLASLTRLQGPFSEDWMKAVIWKWGTWSSLISLLVGTSLR